MDNYFYIYIYSDVYIYSIQTYICILGVKVVFDWLQLWPVSIHVHANIQTYKHLYMYAYTHLICIYSRRESGVRAGTSKKFSNSILCHGTRMKESCHAHE